jgi:hypothetical protein
MGIIVFKIAVALVAALPVGLMLSTGRFRSVSNGRFLIRVLTVQLLPTVVFFVALYVVGHQEVTSDVANFYLPAARAPLAVQMAASDVKMSYAPLFPFVGAGVISLWSSGKAFVVFDVVLNALSLLLWHGAALRLLGGDTARESSLLFAGCGSLLVQVLLGSNQIWVAASLATSTWLIASGRTGLSGLAQGLTVATIKMLTLLFWPVFWICSARRWNWFLAAFLPAVLIYGAFALIGADLLHPLRAESVMITSGNLPYILDPLVATWPLKKSLFDGLAAIALLITVGWLYVRIQRISASERPKLLFAAIALLGLVFMLMSKKTFTYAAFFMYPAVVVAVTRMPRVWVRLGLLVVYNVILSAEPSYWYHSRDFGTVDPSLGAWLHSADWHGAIGLICVDVVLLACYWILAAAAATSIREATAGAEAEQG